MKTTAKDFEKFKAAFLHWQKELGLTHYQVVFECSQAEGVFARIDTNHAGKIATVTLAKNLSPENHRHFDPALSGRHEAIHLLTGRLVWLAGARYLFAEDIVEEDEAIVRRLEHLFDAPDAEQEA